MVARFWLALLLALLLPLATSAAKSADTPGAAESREVSASDLPAEARQTIELIRKGGPFPYERDGVVFGNFEKQLPVEPRGYYREYTVRTPGAKSRGARRIIAGRGGELYYTGDHYRSFRRIKEP